MAGFTGALSRAVASGGSRLLWDKQQKIPTSTPFDFFIRINSLAALEKSGWEIVLGQNIKNVDPQVSTLEESRGVVVSVLCSNNHDKSLLFNQLFDIKLPTGDLTYTEGVSITTGRNQAKNLIFIDTTGTDTPVPKDQLDDKKATEALRREIALDLCSYIIIVVNRLRVTDQSYIRQVLTHSKNHNCIKNIIIVHDLMDVETKKDIDEVIQKEIELLFEAKLDSIQVQINQHSANINFYRSTHYDVKLRHFILAKHGSEAAKTWNSQSIDGIMNILQTATDARRNLDVVNEMINLVNTKLPQLFINNNKQDSNTNEIDQQKFQVQLHSTKPCIVLSHRSDMEDLEQHPDELILSPKLLYDDAGYFIGINSMINGQWQPCYNLYQTNDEIHVIIELAGFKKGEARIQVDEEAIIIEGRRIDFKETLISPIINHENIPTGQFKLEIPWPCKVDTSAANLERDEGFYKIICPKKKVVAKIFE